MDMKYRAPSGGRLILPAMCLLLVTSSNHAGAEGLRLPEKDTASPMSGLARSPSPLSFLLGGDLGSHQDSSSAVASAPQLSAHNEMPEGETQGDQSAEKEQATAEEKPLDEIDDTKESAWAQFSDTTTDTKSNQASSSDRDILSFAFAISRHRNQLLKSSVRLLPPEEPSELGELRMDERQCRTSVNGIVVVDGGSTKTRGQIFTVVVESCPFVGRRVMPDSIKFVEQGKDFPSLREILETWLAENAGPDWASQPFDSAALLKNYNSMQEAANTLVSGILQNAASILTKYLSPRDQEESRVAGIPVFCHSTAGVRDIHDWYREGFFTAIRKAINSSAGYERFLFFTNEDYSRAMTGEEEGLSAFLTANHRLGNFDKLIKLQKHLDSQNQTEETRRLRMKLHEGLIGIVEVGGASMQITFPVSSSAGHPAFVHVTNMRKGGYLTSAYPDIDVLSISFMQLGASSAGGVFLNAFCSDAKNRQGTVCMNPCFHKGYTQECSTGFVQIGKDGTVSVGQGVSAQRLRPVATYCSGTNPEIREKLLNRFSCLAARINPERPLKERLTINGCKTIQGTGDFEKCRQAIDSILINPPAPLPANQEATYTGFDTPSQIFEFMTASSPMYVTGKALVRPVKDLENLGLLSSPYTGDPQVLHDAARQYCATPMIKENDGSLSLHVIVQAKETVVPVNSWNYDACTMLAIAQELVNQLNRSATPPKTIYFESDIIDSKTGKNLGEFGWHVGVILRHILKQKQWARDAYELGAKHTLQDRMVAADSGTGPPKHMVAGKTLSSSQN